MLAFFVLVHIGVEFREPFPPPPRARLVTFWVDLGLIVGRFSEARKS